MIEAVIERLKEFAHQDFPVPEVSSYLLNLNLDENEIKKYSFHKENYYTRNLIHKDTDFELMVICWPPNTSAPIHGHEGEKCWARVQEGQLQICNYEEISSDPLELKMIQELSCSPGFLDGPADIHSVENLSDKFAISLHVYAKPYDACDIYDTYNGKIERMKLGYHSNNGVIC
jgi:predicted metal-dependent enzyme (double-stranded beta helix superfamily)|tara:strand:- start:30 stop:551 length:522 start_codon:yes stop_codon:yes gene_type:complete